MRNWEKTVEQGNKIIRENEALDMKYSEALALIEKYRGKDAWLDAVSEAYAAGLAAGSRV